MMHDRTQKMDYLKTGRRDQGKHASKSVWGRLLKCECGSSMNMRSWNRYKGKSEIAYTCYTTYNKGSKQTRINKGLSLEDCCETPIIPQWKLEMMARFVFKKSVGSLDSIVELAAEILKEHISDKEIKQNNSEIIKKKESEINKLNKKRDTLIEMRSDGDISKDVFRLKSDEITQRIVKLNEEINLLTKTEENIDENVIEQLGSLKKKLRNYVNFKKNETIADEVIEAFFKRIVVSKDEFRWYLRSDDNVMRDNKKLLYLPEDKEDNLEDCKMIASFTMDLEQAKKYLYEFSTKRRAHRWQDIKVTIWL
jgi:hypothetical protein